MKNIKGFFDKTINKIFFTKTIFRTTVVLLFFLGLTSFVLLSSNYKNPYSISSQKYSNFIEFVEINLENEVIFFKAENSFNYSEFLYKEAFIAQSIKKKIITPISFLATPKDVIIAATYACDYNKFDEFKNKYYKINKMNFYDFGINNHKISMERASKYVLGRKINDILIDCEKAKTIPLEPDKYYFLHNELIPFIIGSFILVPFGVLLFLLLIRFIIIAPIIWIFRKN